MTWQSPLRVCCEINPYSCVVCPTSKDSLLLPSVPPVKPQLCAATRQSLIEEILSDPTTEIQNIFCIFFIGQMVQGAIAARD